MASQDKSQASSAFLWFIGPAAVFVTLLFVYFNDNSVAPKETLDGKLPEVKKVEMKATPADTTKGASMEMHSDSTDHADSTAH